MLGARDCSNLTMDAYSRHWKNFIELIRLNKLGNNPDRYVEKYMLVLNEQQLSSASIDQALSAIRTLLKFVFSRGGPELNLGKNIKTKKK